MLLLISDVCFGWGRGKRVRYFWFTEFCGGGFIYRVVFVLNLGIILVVFFF